MDKSAWLVIKQTFCHRHVVLIGLLALICFVSALVVVVQKSWYRNLYAENQHLISQRNQINTEWGQLLIEQGTWGSNIRVETLAKQVLGMQLPSSMQIRLINLPPAS